MGTAVETFQLVVIEDHPAVAAGVERLLGAEEDLVVAGVAVGCGEGVPLAEQLRPDVAIVDMHLSDGNGIRLTQEMIDRRLARSVVIYTAFADDLVGLAALVAGASGVVSKGHSGNELVSAVRAVSLSGDHLDVQVDDLGSFAVALPDVARRHDLTILELSPSDESLESVFAYLVAR